MSDVKIGSVIKAIREELSMTQQDLAAASGVSLATVSKVEQGATSPRPKTIDQICIGLRISSHDLYKLQNEIQSNRAKNSMKDIIIGSGILVGTIAFPPLGLFSSAVLGALGGGSIMSGLLGFFDSEDEVDVEELAKFIEEHKKKRPKLP